MHTKTSIIITNKKCNRDSSISKVVVVISRIVQVKTLVLCKKVILQIQCAYDCDNCV